MTAAVLGSDWRSTSPITHSDMYENFRYIWSPSSPSSQPSLILQCPFRDKRTWIVHLVFSLFFSFPLLFFLYSLSAFLEIPSILFAILAPSEHWVDIVMELVIITPISLLSGSNQWKDHYSVWDGLLCMELFLSIFVTLFIRAWVNGI